MNSTRAGNGDRIRGLPFFFSGRFFFIFGCVSAALIPGYFYFPFGLAIPLLANVVLLLAAFFDLLAGPSTNGILIQRPLPYPLAVDRPTEVALEIANRTGKPVSIIIQDDVPPQCRTEHLPATAVVHPAQDARVVYRVTALERGSARFGNIHFWLPGPMGLVWKRGEIPAAQNIKLYPGLALIERQKLELRRSVAQEATRPLWKKGHGTEFHSLRDYVAGDDFRLIHWPTSARRGNPVVRQNRVERSQTIFIVLDAGRMMTARVLGKTKLDYALDAALLLAYAALNLGDKVGAMMIARDVLCLVPPARTPDQFGRILDSTYALEPRMEEPRFYLALSDLSARLKRRALIVFFTDLIDERASEGLLRYSLGLRPRHLPVVVAMSDTEVAALADSVPEEKQDLYRQGVAAEMLERRERALTRLKSAGVLVIDTPPNRMSVQVLERYMDIKTRNLL
ncbi:MAG: DUF58 domain-containing protein [Desulfomonile tiedjei]|nr:DUF58 domain-containing protein [Desulfomonile tiedjei]